MMKLEPMSRYYYIPQSDTPRTCQGCGAEATGREACASGWHDTSRGYKSPEYCDFCVAAMVAAGVACISPREEWT